jgi:hypothetical protein
MEDSDYYLALIFIPYFLQSNLHKRDLSLDVSHLFSSESELGFSVHMELFP